MKRTVESIISDMEANGAIVYLCTCGLAGVGVVVDLIVLLFKPNPYFP